MRKLNRPQAPDEFIRAYEEFIKTYPPASPERTENVRWEEWKSTHGDAYKQTIDCLWKNQQGLCAYCEVKLTLTNKEIEHFIPKSRTTSTQDWTINFSNYVLSCKGNSNKHSKFYSDDPSPKANLTCGSKKGDLDPFGCLFNPYELPTFPVIKEYYDDEGLSFIPDKTACQKASIDPLIIQSTIDTLGLNCPNLKRRRKAVWDTLIEEYQALVKNSSTADLEKEVDELIGINLEAHSGELLAFYTTRLLFFACERPELIEG